MAPDMTPTPLPGHGDRLEARLRELSGRRMLLAWGRGALWALFGGATAVAFVAWLDLLAPLEASPRIAGLLVAGLFGLAVLVGLLWRAFALAAPARLAGEVDRLAETGGQVSAGRDLAASPADDDPLRRGLTSIAVRQAADIACAVPTGRVEPARQLWPPAVAVAAFLAVLALLWVAWPAALRAEFLRLSDPHGDHPPYSRHRFVVQPGDASVPYGGALPVRVVVEGAPVDQLELVMRQPDGREDALPMFQDRDASWRAQLTAVTEPLTYWVRRREARSLRFKIGVVLVPLVRDVSVQLTPPAYTHLPPVSGALPQGGIAGLRGSQVRIIVRSNCPLSGGELEMTPAGGKAVVSRLPLLSGESSAVVCDFAIESAGKLSICLIGAKGERSTARVASSVQLLKDTAPVVRILSPRLRSFATADIVMPVEIDADDDYGLAGVSLFRALNGSRHLPDELAAASPAQRQLRTTVLLPLKDYGLAPGDVVTLFARAVDSDPTGPKGAESQIVTLTIISAEEFDRLLREEKTAADLEAKYAQARRMVEDLNGRAEELAARLEKKPSDPLDEETRREMQALSDALEKAAARLKLLADRDPIFSLDTTLAEPLRELAAAATKASAELAGGAKAASQSDARQALARARKELGAGAAAYEKEVAQPLERFMRAYALLEMEEQFIVLCEAQEELAQRMAALKDANESASPSARARMRDLRDEQLHLRGELDATLDEIRTRAEALAYYTDLHKLRFSAQSFADKVSQSRAGPAMNECATALQGFRGSESAQRAREAADVLASFIAKCRQDSDESGNACESSFSPRRSSAARQTVSQLLGAKGLGGGQGAGGGYSMRGSSLRNVGLYGGRQTSPRGGMSDGRDRATPGSGQRARQGRSATGEIAGPDVTPNAGQMPSAQGLPPAHRAGVNAYFKRVADETAAGVILDDKQQKEPAP